MSIVYDLSGKKALVTGAATGIGAAIALALARAGADVACHGNRRPADETAEAVRKLGRHALVLTGDLSQVEAPARLVAEAIAGFGGLDILINNAGTIRRAPAVDYAEDDWTHVLETNLSSVFRLCQAAGKHMTAKGSGKIVNIASLLSFQGGVTVPAYAAAKGGVAQLTKALANEWARLGVNVNAIAPGYIETENTRALREDAARNRQILERIPTGRWGKPEDIAGAALFLSSDASEYVQGHVLAVDGGWLGR
jgi:2-dehydro-3-deoxy-D-gluconate 5-dehydrogenase